MPTKSAEELASSNLAYYGKARLEKLPESQLKKLAELMNVKPTETGPDLIESLLKAKEQRKQDVKRSPLSANEAANKIQTVAKRKSKGSTPILSSAYLTAIEKADAEKKVQPAFKSKHCIRVCAFNTKKLVLKQGLAEHWFGVLQTLATFDIILISEAPFQKNVQDQDTGMYKFQLMLNMFNNDDRRWVSLTSEPSGPGNPECHNVFVREPIRVLEFETHFKANGTTLDHAPFTVLIEDDRFESEHAKRWCITSVHFPPKARARERDAQINAFLGEYARSSEFRLSTPMTVKGAKDAKQSFVNHVVCGDFNAHPSDENYNVGKYEFAEPLMGENISTSSGCQAYDNFLVGKDTQRRFSIGNQVLELRMPQRPGHEGVSDHNPIVAKFTETTPTKSR